MEQKQEKEEGKPEKLGTVKLAIELSQVCPECGHEHPFEMTDESLKKPLARNCTECGAYIPAKLEQTAVLGVGPLTKSEAKPPEVFEPEVTDLKAHPVEPDLSEQNRLLMEALKRVCTTFSGLCNVVRVSVQGSSIEFAGDLIVRDSRLAREVKWTLEKCNEVGLPIVVDDAGGDDFGHGDSWCGGEDEEP